MSLSDRGSATVALRITSISLAAIFLLAGQTCAAQALAASQAASSGSAYQTRAQETGGVAGLETTSASSPPDLPDAPQPRGDNSVETEAAATARVPRFAPKPKAPLYDKYIEPVQSAQPLLGIRRKLTFGVRQIASPYFLVAVVSGAGYEQILNGRPNYGTDKGAFGQRLGAAAIHDSSDSVFSDGLMPALLHQDPRFYVMGTRHGLLPRGFYAISRVFVTRSDTGATQANFSLFAGHAATAILENAYYPSDNRGVRETAASFGGSLAGTALSNAVREFLPDLRHLVHLE